jgi:hypothetical protein
MTPNALFALRGIAFAALASLAVACGAPPDGQGFEGAAEPAGTTASEPAASGHGIVAAKNTDGHGPVIICAPGQECAPCVFPNALQECPSGPPKVIPDPGTGNEPPPLHLLH